MEALFFQQCREQMDIELRQIKAENTDPQSWSAKSIPVARKYLAALKSHLKSHPFRRRSEEILFFKEMKPRILGKLLFFVDVFKLSSACQYGKEYAEKKGYWIGARNRIDSLMEEHKELYKYLLSDHDHLDRQIFVRYPENITHFHGYTVDLDPASFYGDPDFSTSHDYRAAQFMAWEDLQTFIHEQLFELEGSIFRTKEKMKFMGTPDDFVEYVRLLHEKGMIEDKVTNEPVSREELAEYLMDLYEVDLGSYPDYATLEACSNGSDLVEKMMDCLENYYDKLDEEKKDVEYNEEGRVPES